MWSRQCQLMKSPCQSIHSVFSQVRFKHFRLCKAVGMELSCSKSSIQLQQEILFSFLGSSLVVLCSIGGWLCGQDTQSWPSTVWSRLDTHPYLILCVALVVGLKLSFLGNSHIVISCGGGKVFPLLSGLGVFGFGEEVVVFHNGVIPVLLEMMKMLVV